MKRFKRESLAGLVENIESQINDAGGDPHRLEQLIEKLWQDCESSKKEKKMGRVRIYDKYGLEVSQKLLESKQEQFNSIPILGIF